MKKRVIFGIYLIAAAVLMLLCGTGVTEGVPALKIAVPLLLFPIFVSGISRLGFVRILMPISLTAITFATELGIDGVSPWVIVIATLLLAVGCNVLVPKKTRLNFKKRKSGESFNNSDPDNIRIESHFGGVEKYIESKCFTSASIDCSFSGVQLFFDKAVMNPDGAVIYIDASYSGICLHIPKGWQVVDRLDSTMSGVESINSEEKPLKLRLEGRVSLCGVEIKYI